MAVARCNFTITWSLAIQFNSARVDYISLKSSELNIDVWAIVRAPPTVAKIVVFSDPTGTEIVQMDLPHY
jgi:hypothetical protein